MPFAALQDGLVIALNVASMLALGLSLSVGQLTGALARGRVLAVGLAVNLVAAPLLAFALVSALELPPAFALGLLICGAAAGGNMGPLFTANARGDIAYAVALVLVLSFASVLAVPFWLRLLAPAGAVDLGSQATRMVGVILIWQVAPLVAGLAGHALHAGLALRAAPVVRAIANLALLVLTVGLLVTKGDAIATGGLALLAAVEGFVLVLLASGLLLGAPRDPTGRALALTSCTRNVVLAMLLASQVFGAEPLVLMGVLTYGLLWLATAMPASFLLKRFA